VRAPGRRVGSASVTRRTGPAAFVA